MAHDSWIDAEREKPAHHDPVLGLWSPPHFGYRLDVVRWDQTLHRWQIAQSSDEFARGEQRIAWWRIEIALPKQ
jgi:hypothetical protein